MIYNYTKIINPDKLYSEIYPLLNTYEGSITHGTSVELYFSSELNSGDKALLDSIVDLHTIVDQSYDIKTSIIDRKTFGEKLTEEFKYKNLQEGITWYQAVHLHSRVRDWKVNYPSPLTGSENVDLFNMILSGDIETASLSLQYGENDDMTLPQHWVTQERRMWLVNKMRVWLGWPEV